MIGSHFESARIRSIKNGTIYLVRAKQNNASIWCYVSVPSQKDALFQKALTSNSIELNKYGIILYSGDGTEPPQMFVDMIERLSA